MINDQFIKGALIHLEAVLLSIHRDECRERRQPFGFRFRVQS